MSDHFLSGDLERLLDGGDMGICHTFETDPNDDTKTRGLEQSQAQTIGWIISDLKG